MKRLLFFSICVTLSWAAYGQSKYDVNGDGFVTMEDANAVVNYYLEHKEDNSVIHAYDYVDLGLKSGTQWAACNLGAVSPEQYGDYYAWAEISPKTSFAESNYKYYVNGVYRALYADISHYFVDAARMNLGDEWRMPRKADVEELLHDCTWTITTMNGVNGYNVAGPSGKSIFIPCAGMYNASGLQDCGTKLYYWTSTRGTDLVSSAYVLSNDGYTTLWTTNRCNGLPIRAVLGD